MERIFGIDLGTTNSEIAYVVDGKPVVATVQEGQRFLPSVVGVDRGGRIVTGFAALNQEAAFPEDTVRSIKRKMGSGETVTMAGKEYTPAEISSHILTTLKEAAERETGIAVRKAVITVPAYFTDLQRKDTIRAGELAGLEVVRIINEPTAAALAYGCKEGVGEKVLVYDLGGGTFDVSLMQIEKDVLEVLATDGDTLLGGDDFDALLVERFLSELPPGAVGPDDRRARARLRGAAERLKIALSTETVHEVREEFIATLDGKPLHLDITVTRGELEQAIDGRLSQTFRLVDRVLGAAKVADKDVSKVLLVGGSTYIPRIFDVLEDERGFSVHREVDPAFAVAIGAAIQGAIIAGEPIGTILVDVNSHSLGIRTLSESPDGVPDVDRYSIVIHRNTPIPASMSETYYTMMDDQKVAEIEAFQGENPVASRNTFVGSFNLTLPRKLPQGSEIDVTFAYDLNGVVEVSARERTSGARKAARFDVNRLSDVSDPQPTDGTPAESAAAPVMDRGKCERILRSARRKSNRFGIDPALAARIGEEADLLEKALAEGRAEALSIALRLAEQIAGV